MVLSYENLKERLYLHKHIHECVYTKDLCSTETHP